MSIERGLAQSGEMFAAADHACVVKSAQKFAGVDNYLLWIVRNRARTHYGTRGLKSQVENRCEIDVEAERAAVFADDASVLAKERTAARSKNLGWRRRPAKDLAKTVDRATFQIHASEKGRGNGLLTFAKKSMRLLRPGDIAGKKDYARRMNFGKQGRE